MTSLWKYLVVKWRKLFAITPEENYPATTLSLQERTFSVLKRFQMPNS